MQLTQKINNVISQTFKYGFIVLFALISTKLFAAINPEELQQQRIAAIKTYVRLLGHGSYQEIPKLFTKHAVAVSASGESDSINHFYETVFLKNMASTQARLINIFDGQLKNNMMTAYYNLSWKGADGIPVSQRYLDLFIFQADSIKIKTVYVFSNSFHDDSFNEAEVIKSV